MHVSQGPVRSGQVRYRRRIRPRKFCIYFWKFYCGICFSLNAVTPLFSLNVLKRTGLPLGVRGKVGNRPTTVKIRSWHRSHNDYFSSLAPSPNRPRQKVPGFLSALSFTRMQCSAWLVRSCSSWAPESIGRLYKYATWMASCAW